MTDTDKLMERLRAGDEGKLLGPYRKDIPIICIEAADALASLKAENERLRHKLDLELDAYAKDHDLATLRAELARAHEALRPFSNTANGYDDELDDDSRLVGPFPLKLCRAARTAFNPRAALSPDPGSGREAGDLDRIAREFCEGALGKFGVSPDRRGQYVQVIRELLEYAAHASPASGEWRDVDTAPRGDWILGAYDGLQIQLIVRHVSNNVWIECWQKHTVPKPDYWQPLPAPPVSRDKREGMS